MATKANPAIDALDEEIEPVADETAQRTRLVVAAHSADIDECTMLLKMLGIGPNASIEQELEESDVGVEIDIEVNDK